MAADMLQVATYIMERGIENFRSTKVKDDNRDVFNYVNRNGGFTKFRDDFINGKYDVYFKEVASKTECIGMLPIIETQIQEVYVPVTDRELNNTEENNNEIVSQKTQQHIDDEVILSLQKAIQDLSSKQEDIIKTLNDMNQTTSNASIMHEKLKLIEGDMVDNIREKIVGRVQKYSYITYGSRKGEAIRRSYRDMYDIFDKCYDVNIEAIQLAYIKRTNMNRIQNGKQPIEYVDASSKVSKINIIERMGMLTEFYLIVKGRLDSLMPN